jgi:hypothetical protein
MQIRVRQRKWLVYPLLVTFWLAYAIETIQNARGFDPRFTQAGTLIDRIIGMSLGVISVFIVISLVYFMVLLFKQKQSDFPLILLAMRYGSLSVMLAIIAGIWMIVYTIIVIYSGHLKPEMPNQMLLHFIGFHGLQAIPVIGWLVMHASLPIEKAKIHVHMGGIAWLLVGVSLFVQIATGHEVYDFTVYLMAALLALLVWFSQVAIVFLSFWKHIKQKQRGVEHV